MFTEVMHVINMPLSQFYLKSVADIKLKMSLYFSKTNFSVSTSVFAVDDFQLIEFCFYL